MTHPDDEVTTGATANILALKLLSKKLRLGSVVAAMQAPDLIDATLAEYESTLAAHAAAQAQPVAEEKCPDGSVCKHGSWCTEVYCQGVGQFKAQPVADDWQHLKQYGYAPGGYMSRCHNCGKMTEFLDKRAICCRPCAESLHAEKQAQPVARTPLTPLTEIQLMKCLAKASCIGTVKMSFESGPYSIDRPSINATKLCEAIEAAIPDQAPVLRQALEAFRIVRLCVPPAQRPTVEAAIAAIEALGITGEQS